MELLIALGRDSAVAYQNDASAKIKPAPLGASIIRNTFVLPWEEIRNLIFSARLFLEPLADPQRPRPLLTRDYRPLLGSDGEIVGFISMGWSRQAPGAQDIPIFPLLFAPRISGTSVEYPPQRRLPGHPGTLKFSSASSTTPAILPQRLH